MSITLVDLVHSRNNLKNIGKHKTFFFCDNYYRYVLFINLNFKYTKYFVYQKA